MLYYTSFFRIWQEAGSILRKAMRRQYSGNCGRDGAAPVLSALRTDPPRFFPFSCARERFPHTAGRVMTALVRGSVFPFASRKLLRPFPLARAGAIW